MPETSEIFFLTPRGARGANNKGGGSRGASFPKIWILGIFGDISSNFSWDRCQKPPNKYFDSLKSVFLVFWVIFLQTWAEIDARNLPKKSFDPQGTRGASKLGTVEGSVFLTTVFSVFLVTFLQTWAKKDARIFPKKYLISRGARWACICGQLGGQFS